MPISHDIQVWYYLQVAKYERKRWHQCPISFGELSGGINAIVSCMGELSPSLDLGSVETGRHFLWLAKHMPGWWFETWLLWLSIYIHIPYWECHHPNWRTPSFLEGVGQPPTSSRCSAPESRTPRSWPTRPWLPGYTGLPCFVSAESVQFELTTDNWLVVSIIFYFP